MTTGLTAGQFAILLTVVVGLILVMFACRIVKYARRHITAREVSIKEVEQGDILRATWVFAEEAELTIEGQVSKLDKDRLVLSSGHALMYSELSLATRLEVRR